MTDTATPPARSGSFWLGAACGIALIAYGVVDLVHQSRATDPPGLALWFAGSGLAHDAVIAPVVVAVGWATRWLPAPGRVPVRLGLAASVLLTLLVWPLAQGWGRNEALPSALPLDYGRNLSFALVAIWAAVAAAVAVRTRRS